MSKSETCRSLRDSLHMNDLPDSVLANVGSFLAKPSRASFAAALTAPSSSWRDTNWKGQPSQASRSIIISSMTARNGRNMNEREECIYEYGLDFMKNLSDDDLGAMLACVNSIMVLKRLKLEVDSSCSITGSGLAPLRGSADLEKIDIDQYGPGKMKMSGAVVMSILESIFDAPNCSLRCVRLPYGWFRDDQHHHETPISQQFKTKYTRLFQNCRLKCDKCNKGMEGYSIWMYCGTTSHTCCDCLRPFCSDCQKDGLLSWCSDCGKYFCADCMPISKCYYCIESSICRDCAESCDKCSDKSLCSECVQCCHGCGACYCEGCQEEETFDILPCLECGMSYCLDCRIANCNKGWRMTGCHGCVAIIASELLEKTKKLCKENEELREELKLKG